MNSLPFRIQLFFVVHAMLRCNLSFQKSIDIANEHRLIYFYLLSFQVIIILDMKIDDVIFQMAANWFVKRFFKKEKVYAENMTSIKMSKGQFLTSLERNKI